MNTFRIGEAAIYVRPGSPYYGREVTVVSGLQQTGFMWDHVTGTVHSGYLGYEVDCAWKPRKQHFARPEWLRKKTRDIDRKVEWRDCLWRPRIPELQGIIDDPFHHGSRR